ncbi:MAG TPA: methyltransferase, partial [Cellvibrionaceae bacterium]|nr:methyltransferase [Cellvibrionaceae bacterium]
MYDGAYRYLIDQLRQTPGKSLWFAEEGCTDYLAELAPFKDKILLLSARVDIINEARQLNIPAHINDAQWPQGESPIAACFIRIAKEKPWVQHLINQARQYLPAGGQLLLAGHKQEGIKTYADKAAALFLSPQKAIKNGDFYSLALTQPSVPAGSLLPCEDYPKFRPVFTLQEKPVYSKPGIYGWDKIDQGSQLLVDTLKAEMLPTLNNCLDLGCGYGYLTLATANLDLGLRTCTDNNQAAVN